MSENESDEAVARRAQLVANYHAISMINFALDQENYGIAKEIASALQGTMTKALKTDGGEFPNIFSAAAERQAWWAVVLTRVALARALMADGFHVRASELLQDLMAQGRKAIAGVPMKAEETP